VVLSTHILPEVEQVCERVFIIDEGRIVADGTPDDLRTRLVGNPTVSVEIKDAPAEARAAILGLPGVADVRNGGGAGFKVEHPPDQDPREQIFRLAVERDWTLLTLAPEKATLEDVFVRLTTREEVAATSEEEV
jgi:ABC-2 type transport system ATP-binding protein